MITMLRLVRGVGLQWDEASCLGVATVVFSTFMNLIREGPKSSNNCALDTVHASEGINQNETPVKGRSFCIKFEVCPCCHPSLRCFLTSKRRQAVASLVSHA